MRCWATTTSPTPSWRRWWPTSGTSPRSRCSTRRPRPSTTTSPRSSPAPAPGCAAAPTPATDPARSRCSSSGCTTGATPPPSPSCRRRSPSGRRRPCRGAPSRCSTPPTSPTACPTGLGVPRGLRVDEHDDETAVVWIEAVERDPAPWTYDDSVRAARLLGRLSGSPRVAAARRRSTRSRGTSTASCQGRLAHTVLPGLHDDATWRHPAVAEHFGDLRDGPDGRRRPPRRPRPTSSPRACTGPRTATPAPTTSCAARATRASRSSTSASGARSRSASTSPSSSSVTSRSGARTPTTCPSAPTACVEAYAAGLADEGLEVPAGAGAARPRGEPDALQRPAQPAARECSRRRRPGRPAASTTTSVPARPLGAAARRIARYALDVLARTEPTA